MTVLHGDSETHEGILLAHYKEKAAQRGRSFRTEHTVKAVEHMLLEL